MNLELRQTYIGRLRANVYARDAGLLAARLRNTVATLDLHPPDLPAHAVVCLKRLRAPLPENIFNGSAVDSRRVRAWETATAHAIHRVLSSAARPAREPVPAGAECVVFADRAELLACFAEDWCAERVHACWWWQSNFMARERAGAPLALWRRAPEYVPGALAHLARRNSLMPFARVLPNDDVVALLGALLTRFALRELTPLLSGSGLTQMPVRPGSSITDQENRDRARTGNAPWQQIVPESRSATLSPAQQCLLGIGLMLQRAPAVLRTAAFARAAQQWLSRGDDKTSAAVRGGTERHDAAVAAAHSTAAQTTNSLGRANVDTPISGFAGTQPRQTGADEYGQMGQGQLASLRTSESDGQHNSERDVSTQADARPDKQFADAHANSFADESGRATRTESAAQELSAFGAEESASTLGARESEPAHVLAADPPREFTSTPAARAALPVDEELAIKIETRGGGLFCLINLALALELYGDFTTPLAPGLPLSLWDFVAMLGARLLKRELHDDPVWTLLAQLAGRDPRTAPGVDFAPPDEWRMPGAWLADLPRGGAWRWALLRDRLQVMHPSGFLVIDVPRDARPPVPQLAAEMEAYTDLHDGALLHATRGVRLRGSTTRARWLARLTAYVCVRLRHALGERETRTAARLLCLLPARIVATTTHLDVHVSLCDLPVAVRRAGLDRDPGWVPAAGRFIAFHFE